MPALETVTQTPMNRLGHQYPLGANMVEMVNATTVGMRSNKGFSCNETGTVTIRPRLNQAAVLEYPVIAGVIYPVDVADFTLETSSSPTMQIYLHRQG